MARNPDMIGRGWAFPFRFTFLGRTQKLVGVTPADNVDKVRMAIRQILGTRIGSRAIDRDFGSDLRNMIFVPIDEVSVARLRFALTEAIQRWEKRVEITNIEISVDRAKEGVLEAIIDFRMISTQEPGNLVWPLYLSAEMMVTGQLNV
jgi:hypothetical protein